MATTIGRAAAPVAATAVMVGLARGVTGLRRRWGADRACLRDALERARATVPETGGSVDRVDDAIAEVRHDALAALLGIEAAARALGEHRDLLSAEQSDELAAAMVAEVHRLGALLGRPSCGDGRVDLRAAVAPVVVCARADGLTVGLAVEAGLEVVGSTDDVARVLRTLLDNARRHAPGAAVRVWAEAGPSEVVLRVDDEGPGVAATARPALFERGARFGPGAGSGLGLHVARRLAARHGGSLTYEPCRRGGSSFVVRLPRLPGRVPAGRDLAAVS